MNLPNIQENEIDVVREELLNDPMSMGYSEADSVGKASLLVSQPLVDNEEGAGQVLASFSLRQVMEALSDAGKAWVAAQTPTSLETIGGYFRRQDRQAVLELATVKMSPEDQAAIYAILTATVPDPTYQQQVPSKSRLETILNRNGAGIMASEVEAILKG